MIMMQQVRLMMFSLKMVGWGGGMGWGGGVVVAHKILVSAQGPLVFGIWVWGLGVWGLGLTI